MLKDNNKMSEEDIIKLKNASKKFSFIQVTYLFGSQVKGRITPLSDIDIALLTERKL
ncbi:MAG: nucleotidyltransferase domain-containing protein [Euryarchaeota archaeon]|nr:nucleotidyltransferase domain-containing protein [Euryarchaeota archaeon]